MLSHSRLNAQQFMTQVCKNMDAPSFKNLWPEVVFREMNTMEETLRWKYLETHFMWPSKPVETNVMKARSLPLNIGGYLGCAKVS